MFSIEKKIIQLNIQLWGKELKSTLLKIISIHK